MTPTFAIGDYVWTDTNNNGIPDAGEPGINGVTVTLRNTAGTVVGTTTTNSKGYYHFDNLPAGNYTEQFTAPTGSTFTAQTAGTDVKLDSNPNSVGLTGTIVLALPAGGNNVTASIPGDNVTATYIDRTIDAGIIGQVVSTTTATTTTGSGGGLAYTGFNLASKLWSAFVLVMAGALVLLLARRRRSDNVRHH